MKIDNHATPDEGTKLVAKYIQEKGMSMVAISKYTGISYDKLRRSLSKKTRALKADEFLRICGFLEVDPMKFFTKQKAS